ncbi:MAG: lysophospholipid acyltransferase family protein [Dehalococcoidia bacterium]
MRKRLMGLAILAVYWGANYALRAVLTVLTRWRVKGREKIPMEGGLIVVSNHLNNADPPILASGIARRRIRFMAKIELFKYPFGIVPRLYGAFPVRRFEADMGALMAAERLLKRGEVLGMFPEGTRSRTGKIGTPHPGTAVIALRTGATVLPCAIHGTEQLRNPLNVLKYLRMGVTIADPIHVEQVKRPTEEQVQELTDRIFGAITALLPEQYLPTYTESEETPAPEAVASQVANGSDSAGE